MLTAYIVIYTTAQIKHIKTNVYESEAATPQCNSGYIADDTYIKEEKSALSKNIRLLTINQTNSSSESDNEWIMLTNGVYIKNSNINKKNDYELSDIPKCSGIKSWLLHRIF